MMHGIRPVARDFRTVKLPVGVNMNLPGAEAPAFIRAEAMIGIRAGIKYSTMAFVVFQFLVEARKHPFVVCRTTEISLRPPGRTDPIAGDVRRQFFDQRSDLRWLMNAVAT